jgi:D-sedoheptulose 7-phosphate isomerase
MKNKTQEILNTLFERYPKLEKSGKEIIDAFHILLESYGNNGKLLVCGNGGSAADSLHIVGELMKGFELKRPLSPELAADFEKLEDGKYLKEHLQMTLPAISLVNESGLTTAVANDTAGEMIFAQQVLGYGLPGDVFLGISTSGNSKNVVYAAEVAKVRGMKVLGLTGASGGRLKKLCDSCICVDETETFKVQELHLPVYHALCLALEFEIFGEE